MSMQKMVAHATACLERAEANKPIAYDPITGYHARAIVETLLRFRTLEAFAILRAHGYGRLVDKR